ncbi:hypothetical protein AB0301_14750 [Microbacterium profundi]|uniref:Uncharacterized protein n=1 Tax=Microbacterium profundi TaxID=450380 RepID=A0ABV3LKK4_9MICO
MPTFDDPLTDAIEASAALRGLAHATRTFATPADTYPVLGDVLAGVRSLRQVVDQIAREHLIHRARAHDDDGNQTTGASEALAAADDLLSAANTLDGVEQRLDAALGHSGRIAWHPGHPGGDRAMNPPTAGPLARWISVVFLQGDEADVVLDRIDRDGPDAAIEHLTQWDFGEETTTAALENGYVYDEPPAGPADKVATVGDYTLTYNALLGHVSLLRAHRAAPDPTLDATSATLGGRAGARVPEGAAAAPAARAALRQRTPGGRKQDWFAPRPVSSTPAAMGRSL